MVKNLPVMRETQETPVRSLRQEDSLEKGTASIPVFCPENPVDRGAVPWTGGLQSIGSQRIGQDGSE